MWDWICWVCKCKWPIFKYLSSALLSRVGLLFLLPPCFCYISTQKGVLMMTGESRRAKPSSYATFFGQISMEQKAAGRTHKTSKKLTWRKNVNISVTLFLTKVLPGKMRFKVLLNFRSLKEPKYRNAWMLMTINHYANYPVFSGVQGRSWALKLEVL